MKTIFATAYLVGCLLGFGTAAADGRSAADASESGPAARDRRLAEPAAILSLPLNALAATAEQRLLLTYLVSCALPEGVVLHADVAEERYRFAGSLGLAPAWTERGLTRSEQRWVSACILARTNLFGREVAISMRAPEPAPAALQSSPEERRSFTLFEGGFFGNIFQDELSAFTCSAQRNRQEAADRILEERVCTQPSGATLPSGESLTRCGFVHRGICPDPERPTAGFMPHREVIFTYLRPAGP